VDSSHEEKCMRCRSLWHLSALAYHEATHAAAALDLGLKVEFVAIDDEREVEVTKLEATLYPIIKAGMKVPATLTRLGEKSLRDEPINVMVAMVAPSCVHTGHRQIDDYAAMESFIAVQLMQQRGIDSGGVLDRALRVVQKTVVQDHVLELAELLAATGWVDL
jgi:hypothetical protein